MRPPFRYDEFCPIARAAEVLGERWTLLILRELFFGPQRFVDLRQQLPGVTPGVLAQRLARLESLGLVARRALPPPAARTVYELDAAGRALSPALVELVRWGTRFLLPQRPGEDLRPKALQSVLPAYARTAPTPAVRLDLEIEAGTDALRVRVEGGTGGARVTPLSEPEPDPRADAVLRAAPIVLFELLAGQVRADDAVRQGRLRLRGSRSAAAALPRLFDVPAPALGPDAASELTRQPR